jgi:hypothetical protein
VAILTQGGVIARVQALLDDPAGRRFSPDYLRPYIDQENEELQIMLERLGVQQEEQIAIFDVPPAAAAPSDLTPYFAPGMPLQYLMRPKGMDWKLQTDPDTLYQSSQLVTELDDVQTGHVGCQEYRWAGGAIQTTPSYTAVTLRVYFYALSQTMYDSAGGVMRGIGGLLALQAACFVAALNNNMGKTYDKLRKDLARNKISFANLMVMQGQSKMIVPHGTKRGVAVQISAGGVPYM